jgi:hypothetical protein
VDDEDYEWLNQYKWSFEGRCASRGVRHPHATDKGITQKMHRLIMGLEFGDKRVVDHIDGNPLNNRRSNLRVCTHRENMRNRKHHASSSNALKGVKKNGNRWRATITIDYAQKNLGSFSTAEEAHAAYCRAAAALHGEFARFE